jgi:hypothetical protein
MMGTSKTGLRAGRVLASVLVIVALFLPRPLDLSAAQRDQPVQILAVAGSSPTVLASRTGRLIERAGQRAGVDSTFVFAPHHSGTCRCGRSINGTEARPVTETVWAVRTQSGRSPPFAIS